jgi:hypothetical protein
VRQDVGVDLPEQRVGDRERRLVDARLQAAVTDGVLTLSEYDERAGRCWAARTRADLDAVVRDLPPDPGAALAEAGPATTSQRVTAVLSESELAAPVRPGQDVVALAVLGTSTVDLRRADLPRSVRVRATAVLGEVEVHVPPGTTVHLTGAAVMGERKVRTGAPDPDGRVVHVDATAVLGTVKVDDKPRKGGLLPASAGIAPAPHRRSRRTGAVAGTLVAGALVLGAGAAAVQVLGADDGTAVLGSRTVVVQDGRAEVGVLLGSVEVVVPDDARVRTEGTVVLGSVECGAACSASGTGPVVVVRATGGLGSVSVVRQSEREVDDG